MAEIKYNINVNQLVLSQYKELDVVDGAILDYLQDICSSTNEKIVNKRKLIDNSMYTWIDLKTLAERMPLIKISSIGALSRRFKKMEDVGLIKTNRQIHQKLYICLTSEFDKLLISINSPTIAIDLNQQPSGRAIDTNQQSYSPTSTNAIYIDNNNIDTREDSTLSDIGKKVEVSPPEVLPNSKIIANSSWSEYFEYYKEQSGEKRVVSTEGRKAKFRTRLQTYTLDELKLSVYNAFHDDFFSGKNDRGWRANIDYLLRNDEVVDRLMRLKPRQKNATIVL